MRRVNLSKEEDLRIIRKILKEDIKARQLILTAPGLTERERLRHKTYIAVARIHRLSLSSQIG